MDDSSYVLLRKIRDQHMTEFGREFNLDTIDALRAIRELIASIRAEARAEALREAKGKLAAMEKLLTTRYRSDYEEGFGDALNEAQDIILADEPNERDSREGLLYKSDVDDRGEG